MIGHLESLEQEEDYVFIGFLDISGYYARHSEGSFMAVDWDVITKVKQQRIFRGASRGVDQRRVNGKTVGDRIPNRLAGCGKELF